MPATAPSPTPAIDRLLAHRASATAYDASLQPATPQPPDRRCRYCCAGVAQEAKKCRSCGEWLVGTSAGLSAALLRLLGWSWAALSGLTAGVVWYVGGAIKMQLLLRSADRYLTPLGLDAAHYAIIALVLLQGLTVGVGLNVIAGLVPRRPRWWNW